MSSRDAWVPIAAATLKVPTRTSERQDIFVLVGKTVRVFAEERERRNAAVRESPPGADVVESSQSWWGQWWASSGEGGDAISKMWLYGSTAALMGLITLLYKNVDKLKTLVWKTKTCETKIVKSKPSAEKIKLCICKD
ncbi:uncharacterized protein LOC123654779 [Melitaea cinxia]|uniref:uncharacterized protein LOC123654779 n=1 Tax=Melitaea cinxia TaxID=113334 RepID=UPI001E26FB55|nr:uncharacterized protein LOC123654779 [Melitaea cinxia]